MLVDTEEIAKARQRAKEAEEAEAAAAEAAEAEGSKSTSLGSLDLKVEDGRGSPIATSWHCEVVQRRLRNITVVHYGMQGPFPANIKNLHQLQVLELPCLRPWDDPLSVHELVPKHLHPAPIIDIPAGSALGHVHSLRRLNLHGNMFTGQYLFLTARRLADSPTPLP